MSFIDRALQSARAEDEHNRRRVQQLERKVRELERKLEERPEANAVDYDRLRSLNAAWADLHVRAPAAAGEFRSAVSVALSGIGLDSVSKDDAVEALYDVVKAAGPMTEICEKQAGSQKLGGWKR